MPKSRVPELILELSEKEAHVVATVFGGHHYNDCHEYKLQVQE